MIFRPFYYFDRGCAAYLFGCGSLGRCAVVKPADMERILASNRSHGEVESSA